jgi:hypothetical protein
VGRGPGLSRGGSRPPLHRQPATARHTAALSRGAGADLGAGLGEETADGAAHRRRGGSTNGINWLLRRGYHVHCKGISSKRGAHYALSVRERVADSVRERVADPRQKGA